MSTYAGRFNQALFDGTSLLQKSKTYRIYTDSAATTLAVIYTDRTKTTQVVQPLTTDSDGMASFFADPGTYYLKVGSGATRSIDIYEDKADTAEETEFQAHVNATTDIHGIPDASVLETVTGSQTKADGAETAAKAYTDEQIGESGIGSDTWLRSNVSALTYGDPITRDANDAVTTANVVWPDGTVGVFTADVLNTTFLGAIDAYHVTYLGTVTKTVTQPAVTRSATGAVIGQPELEVS